MTRPISPASPLSTAPLESAASTMPDLLWFPSGTTCLDAARILHILHWIQISFLVFSTCCFHIALKILVLIDGVPRGYHCALCVPVL